MGDIDGILEQFGGDATNISINYIDGKWRMDYDNKHIESGDTLSECADKMLSWYMEMHTYKRAAEDMWIALELLSNDVSSKVRLACEIRNEYITRDSDGNLVWNPAYHDCGHDKPKNETVCKSPEKEVIAEISEPPAKSIPKRDEYPDYFIVEKNDMYTVTDCWGYDVNGSRMHVVVDRRNPKACSIGNATPKFDDSVNTVEINESEYNDYYDEACRLISKNL